MVNRSEQVIQVTIREVGDNKEIHCYFVYGLHNIQSRVPLLTELGSSIDASRTWVALGAFNAVFTSDQKIN